MWRQTPRKERELGKTRVRLECGEAKLEEDGLERCDERRDEEDMRAAGLFRGMEVLFRPNITSLPDIVSAARQSTKEMTGHSREM